MSVATLLSAKLAWFLDIFSKPQRRHFLAYIMGLMLIVRFRSVRRISGEFSRADQSALNHFLTDASWEGRELVGRSQALVRERIGGRAVQFVIDDTADERKGKCIEGVGVHHCGNGLVRGHCLVAASVFAGGEMYLWDFRGYVPKGGCKRGEFKSKVELAVDMIRNADMGDAPAVLALWDAWYTCEDVAKAARGRGWHYLGAVRKNRIIFIGRERHRARDLAKGRRCYDRVKCGSHSFRAARVEGWLGGLGEAAVFIVKSERLGTRFLVTSDMTMSAAEAVRTYARRFWIETQFREAKQLFGLGELFLRKWRGVQKHWALVMTAYNVAQMLKRFPKLSKLKTTGAVLRALQGEFRTKDVKLFMSEILSKAA